jgi:hypothetical protein
MSRLCTQVQVGKDQRVVRMRIHGQFLAEQCYGAMKYAPKFVHW